MGELGDDGLVGVEVWVAGGEDQAEIKDEFVARIGG